MTTEAEPRWIEYQHQHDGALHVLGEHERTTVLIAGRKWRKSSNIIVPSQAHDLCDGIDYISLAPTYDQVMEVWIELERCDTDHALRFSLSTRTISCPYSGARGVYRSMDRPENVRSKNARKIYADEVQGIDRDDYDRVILPIGLNFDVEEILVGSASGHDWVADYGEKIAKLPGGHYWRIPTRGYRWGEDGRLIPEPHPLENDQIPFERLQFYADRLSRDAFDQEIGAKEVAKSGRILADFSRDRHCTALEYRPGLPVYLSVDPGLVVCAVGIYQVAAETVYKIGEATLRDRTPEQAIAILQGFRSAFPVPVRSDESLAAVLSMGMDWQKNLRNISMDPQANARDQQTAEREERLWRVAFGVPVETSTHPEHKNPEWRAETIRARQFSASGKVRERVDPCCIDSIASYEQLCWTDKERVPEHSPHKHHFDERGYFEVNHFHKGVTESGQTRNR